MKQTKGCQVHLSIFVKPKAVSEAYKQAVKTINKEVSLPGFRKGKAPSSVIEQNFKKPIEQEMKDFLLNKSFNEALKLTGIYPLRQNSIRTAKLLSCSQEEGAKVEVSFERTPEIPDVNLGDIKLQSVPPTPVSDEMIEDEKAEIVFSQATWIEVKDRGIRNGDYADLSIEALDGPEGQPGRVICRDARFHVEKNQIGEWLRTLLLEKKTGDVFEATSEQDENAKRPGKLSPDALAMEKMQFRPTRCKITIKGIFEGTLPVMDDELARKVGADDLADLTQKIERKLAIDFEKEALEKMREHLETHFADHYSFDIPLSDLEEEKKLRQDVLTHRLQKEHKSKELIAEELVKQAPQIQEDSERTMRVFWLLQKLNFGKEHPVTRDEMIYEWSRQLWMLPPEKSMIYSGMEPDLMNRKLAEIVWTKKALTPIIESLLAQTKK